MESGTVCTVNISRGFGFIRGNGGNGDVFFHMSALDESLEFDERLKERRVEFDVFDTERGPKAANIRAAE